MGIMNLILLNIPCPVCDDQWCPGGCRTGK